MKSISVRDPFNIAPHAPRHTRASWMVLAAGLLFAGGCIWPLAQGIQAMKQATDVHTAANAAVRSQADVQRTALLRQNDPAALARAKAQQKIQTMLRMSWSGLFGALETAAQAVRGGVSILALVPSNAQANVAQVSVTALAANPHVMLKYVDALQKNSYIRNVEVTMQQPDEKTGPDVIRFQMTVLWDPSAMTLLSQTDTRANVARPYSTLP